MASYFNYMLNNLFIFIVSLFIVIKGATISTKYAGRLAEVFKLSKYTIGFIVVAIISILPETFISINSAFEGVPEFGLGTLFGGNVADLTLVFFIILIFAGRKIKIESVILKNNLFYPLLLLVPIILGLNGHYSRLEGAVLIIIGIVFYYITLRRSYGDAAVSEWSYGSKLKNFAYLVLGLLMLLTGSHFIVTSATSLAGLFAISPVLIGMLVVGVGTTIPELFFSLNAVKKNDCNLAIGDIFGTVLADATIVVGLLALISPFSFPVIIVYVTGLFMVGASIILLLLMRSGEVLTRKESYILFSYWLIFVFVEFFVSK